VEGLAASGVRPLRVGFGGKVKASLLEHTLDYKIANHPLTPALAAPVKQEEELALHIRTLLKKIDEVKPKAVGLGASGKVQERARQILANMEADLVARQRKQSALKARIYALHMEILRDVVSKADVVRSLFFQLLATC
jgi:hypothetical protein